MLENLNICLSGGATGADQAWGDAALAAGHDIVHWSFAGHKTSANYLCELPDVKLRVADSYLELANKSIHRKWPTKSPVVNNLLRRNFYQVHWSDSVYAVSTFTKDSSLLQIAGGTAWACQLFVDKYLYTNNHINCIRLFLLDQVSDAWYQWTGQWNQIDRPPPPSGVYAGIGTRELTNAGRKAISEVYG
jgi:hypothetical protein